MTIEQASFIEKRTAPKSVKDYYEERKAKIRTLIDLEAIPANIEKRGEK